VLVLQLKRQGRIEPTPGRDDPGASWRNLLLPQGFTPMQPPSGVSNGGNVDV
jgi:hypothetical protein